MKSGGFPRPGERPRAASRRRGNPPPDGSDSPRNRGGSVARSLGKGEDWIRFAPFYPGIERIEAFFAGHAYDPHRHDTYAIGLTIAGVQSFDYRGARADSVAGRVLVLHPDEVHDGRAGAPGGFRYRMLYIRPALIRDALGGAGPLPFVPEAVTAEPRLRRAVTRALAHLAPLEPLEADQLVMALADALAANDPSLRRGGRGRRRPEPSVDMRAAEAARAVLDAHFDRPVASEALEAAAGLDRWRLARHFRARFGTSPYRYLTMRRLDRARALMRDGLPLAEVAAACGFADQSHMTRRFKRAYGLAPGRWRAILRHA